MNFPITVRSQVLPQWCDHNEHLNLAYYVLIFDYATEGFFAQVGIDDEHRKRFAGSTFAAESHTVYHREVRESDPVYCTTQLIDFDAKRMHYFHRMYHATDGYLAATTELVSLYVDMSNRRVGRMPSPLLDKLEQIFSEQRDAPLPQELGRVIGVPAVSSARAAQ